MTTSVWKGSITVGMINIPVKLYKLADKPTSVSFNKINKDTGNRVAQPPVDALTQEPVTSDQVVKGYKVDKDEYIIIDPDEIAQLHPKRSDSLDIVARVKADAIDPALFDEPYALGCDQTDMKVYQLLHDTMMNTQELAVAKIVMRQTERLCIIAPSGSEDHPLNLYVLRWGSQLRDICVAPEPVETSEREQSMMQELFNDIPESSDIMEFTNDYDDKLIELIESHANGDVATVTVPQYEPKHTRDIMDLLEEAVEQARNNKAKKGEAS